MLNSVALIGRLTNNIEVKTFDNGDRSTNFSLAVQRNFKNKDGEYECDFINCQARNGTADLLYKYFDKGDFCPVRGEIRTRKYEKDGVNHTVTYVVVSEITFIGSKKDNSSKANSAPANTEPNFNPEDFNFEPSGNEDDLPF